MSLQRGNSASEFCRPPSPEDRRGNGPYPSNTHDRYSGSLTTPPCTENVTWLISSEILTVSEVGFENVRNVIGFNSRFPQNSLGEPNVLQLALEAVSAGGEDVAEPEEGEVPDAEDEDEDAADPEEDDVVEPDDE